MQRYFFNLYAPDPQLDDEGLELESFEVAFEEAVRSLGEATRELATDYRPDQEFRLELLDGSKKVLARVRVVTEIVDVAIAQWGDRPALRM
jgi:hypothetical protein